MIRADKFTCEVPTEGSVFLECSLPSAGAIEWFGAIVGALSLMVAAGAAWASIRFANREHQRAEKFEKKSVRERVGNQAVQAYIAFSRNSLSGDFEEYENLNAETIPYREHLDQSIPREKKLYEDLLTAYKCVAMLHTYAVFYRYMVRKPVSKDREIRLKGAASELSREVQSVIHGFSYSQDGQRLDELGQKFSTAVTKVWNEVDKYTKVDAEDR